MPLPELRGALPRQLCYWRVSLRPDPMLKRIVIATPRPRYAVLRRRVAAEKWGMRDDAPPGVTRGNSSLSFS